MKTWISLAALALLAGCATHREARDEFEPLQRAFMAEYEALRIPDFGPSYAANLESIGAPEALAERGRFFSAWRSRFDALSRNSLARAVRPAYDTLLFEIEFNLERARLEGRYAQARSIPVPADGLSKLPDARQWYAVYLKRNASRETTPEALFAFSESEVARIRGEMRRLQEGLGYAGRDGEWRERLRSQVVTKSESVARQFARVRDVVQVALPRYFARTDLAPPPIKPVPHPTKDTPPGYYDEGVFYFSFFGDRFPGRSFGWMYLHEAIPGHHYQLSLQPEGRGFWYPATVEGWGAYCEDLGTELGVYADPDLHYGKWEWDLVRSARVALDVGIHSKGWSRAQALDYWRANVPDQDEIAIREIDRITRWPAQVVSYKVGESAILELRADFTRRQGASFDVRDFHARVLGLGVVPISVLERALRESLG